MSAPHRRQASLAAFAILASLGAASAAQASVITFAQFTEAGPGGNAFAYQDNGPTADAQLDTISGSTIAAPIPVNFTFLSSAFGALPADLIGSQNATLTMTSSTLSPILPGPFDTQSITGAGSVVDTLTFTRDTPAAEGAGSRTNLLTITFTGLLAGPVGGRTPQLIADTGLGYTVDYSSDFLDFSGSTERDFSLTFSSWTTSSTGNGLSPSSIDSYFSSATAAAAGTFDGTVPEPSTLALAALAALALLSRRPRQPAR